MSSVIFHPNIWARLVALIFIAFATLARAEVDPEVAAVLQQSFTRSCSACHGPDVPKPKGGFGYITDLARLAADRDYIVPGHPEQSAIYHVLTAKDPDERMPPARSDEQPFSPAEVLAVKTWILQLATPAAAAGVPSVAISPTPVAAPMEKKKVPLLTTIGHTHPLLIHFPIALLLVGALVEFVAMVRRKPGWETVRWFILLGAAGSLVAVGTGLVDATVEGYEDKTIWFHRAVGIAVASCATLSAIFFVLAQRTGARWMLWVARLLLFASAALVALSGHSGGELVYGEGYTI